MDYQEIAKQAAKWAYGTDLSRPIRNVARRLAELSSYLADPYYGCPAEVEAAKVMHDFLCQAIARDKQNQLPPLNGAKDV